MLGGTVRGATTRLRLPTEADLPSFQRWAADLRIRRGGRVGDLGWPTTMKAWHERLHKETEDKATVLWGIESDEALVGVAKVRFDEPPAADGVDIARFVIDPELWGHGLGWDAALTLHRWIFDIVHLQWAAVELPGDAAAALAICERVGYARFAHGHDVYYRDGAYCDQYQLRMDLATWDERWGAEQREYPRPLGPEDER